MSYAKLSTSDVEAAPIPTLHDLQAQCELGKLPVESTAPAPVAEKSNEVAATATATATIVSVPVPQVASPQSGYSVNSCCCGCSLATGIRIMSYFDMFHAISMFMMAAWFLWLKINEGKVDSMLEDQLAADEAASADEGTSASDSTITTDSEEPVETEPDSTEIISTINQAIDFNTYLIPFYVLFGIVLMHYACKGFKAAGGDVPSAISYLKFRKAILIVTCVSGMFFTGLLGAIFQIALAYYFMVVVRSHLNRLVDAQADAASASIVVIS